MNLAELIKQVLSPIQLSMVYLAQSGAGQPKKGMPGHNQFHQQNEVNLHVVITALMSVLEIEAPEMKQSNLVAGLPEG